MDGSTEEIHGANAAMIGRLGEWVRHSSGPTAASQMVTLVASKIIYPYPHPPTPAVVVLFLVELIRCKKSTPIKPIPSQTKINTIKTPSICKCFPSPKKSPPHQLPTGSWSFSPSHSCQVEVLLVEWIRLHYILAFPKKRLGFERKAIQMNMKSLLTRSQLVYDLKTWSLNLSVPKFLWRSKKSGSLTLLPLATCCILLSSCYRQKFSL